MKVMTALIPCHWNPAKTWVVTRTQQGKYLINQMINGKLFYPKFGQSRKYGISEATCRTMEELGEIFAD